MVFAVGIAVVALVGLNLAQRGGLRGVNAISLFSFPWIFMLVLASFPGVLASEPSAKFWYFPILALLGVQAGTLLGGILGSGRSPVPRRAQARDRVRDLRLLKWFHILFFSMLCGYVLYQADQLAEVVAEVGGWGEVFGASALEFKHAQAESRVATISGGLGSGGILGGVMNYALFLGHASVFTGAVLWARGSRVFALLPLLPAAVYSLISMQRTSFTMVLLLFMLSVIAITQSRAKAVVRKVKLGRMILVTLIGGIAAGVLLVPLALRNEGSNNSTGVQSLIEYVLSGVVGLNERLGASGQDPYAPPLESGYPSDIPGLGAHTFTGFFTLLRRFGIEVPAAPHALDYTPAPIAGNMFGTNTATGLIDYWFDFYWLGVFVIPLVFAFFATVAQRRLQAGELGAVPYFAFFGVALLWSFFVNAIVSDPRYFMVAIVGSIIYSRLNIGPEPHPIGSSQTSLVHSDGRGSGISR